MGSQGAKGSSGVKPWRAAGKGGGGCESPGNSASGQAYKAGQRDRVDGASDLDCPGQRLGMSLGSHMERVSEAGREQGQPWAEKDEGQTEQVI